MSIRSSVRVFRFSELLCKQSSLPVRSCMVVFDCQNKSSYHSQSHSFQSTRRIPAGNVNAKTDVTWKKLNLSVVPTGCSSLSSHHRFLVTSSSNAALENQKTQKYTPPPATPAEEIKADRVNTKSFVEEYKRTLTEVEGKLKSRTGGLGVKELFKKYGIPFMVWYSTLYFGGMGACFLVIESGLVGEAGVIDWLRMTPIADYYDLSKINPKMGNFAGAVAINEVLELVRLPVAILTIPYIKAAWDKRKNSGQQKS